MAKRLPPPDHYQRLSVAPTASAADIKKAYRKLARTHHPDRSTAMDATRRMAELNEAHAVLCDPEKRALYDEEVRIAARFAESQAADFFDNLFRRGESAHRAARPATPSRGEDQHATISLSLAQAYAGVQHTLRLLGVIPQEFEVTIPAGVFDGQQIRLVGRGGAGLNGGAPGDLFLHVQLARDPRWRTEGRDVYGTLALAPWEAALGAWVIASTPIGSAEVHVPTASVPGRTLRLKGRGLPGDRPGDLYLAIQVVWPPASDAAARAGYTALQAACPTFTPRSEHSAQFQ